MRVNAAVSSSTMRDSIEAIGSASVAPYGVNIIPSGCMAERICSRTRGGTGAPAESTRRSELARLPVFLQYKPTLVQSAGDPNDWFTSH